jgi:hypothetical protein
MQKQAGHLQLHYPNAPLVVFCPDVSVGQQLMERLGLTHTTSTTVARPGVPLVTDDSEVVENFARKGNLPHLLILDTEDESDEFAQARTRGFAFDGYLSKLVFDRFGIANLYSITL